MTNVQFKKLIIENSDKIYHCIDSYAEKHNLKLNKEDREDLYQEIILALWKANIVNNGGICEDIPKIIKKSITIYIDSYTEYTENVILIKM